MLVEWQSLLLLLPERYPQLVTEEQVLRGIDFIRSEIGRYGQLVLTSSLSSLPLLIGLMIYLVLVPISSGRLDSDRSEEHTSELQSLMRISYAVFCLKKKNNQQNISADKRTRT